MTETPSGAAGGNTKWYSPFGKTVWQLLIKLNIFLLYIPVVALLAILLKELKTYCTQNFTEELVLIKINIVFLKDIYT